MIIVQITHVVILNVVSDPFLLSEYFFQACCVFRSICFTIIVAFAFPFGLQRASASHCRITRVYLEMTRWIFIALRGTLCIYYRLRLLHHQWRNAARTALCWKTEPTLREGLSRVPRVRTGVPRGPELRTMGMANLPKWGKPEASVRATREISRDNGR